MRLIENEPDIAAGAIRAIVKTQAALRANPSLAAGIGEKLFPASEAALIEQLIARDLPFYDASISPEFVAAMNRFSRDVGILKTDPAYSDIVATQFSEFWPRASAR
jgi:ABC-type nitrate/sulfonate/bicarbonate transport system substrate-binding protein